MVAELRKERLWPILRERWGRHANGSVHFIRFPRSWISGRGRDDSDTESFHKRFEPPVERLGRGSNASTNPSNPTGAECKLQEGRLLYGRVFVGLVIGSDFFRESLNADR